MSEHLDPIEKIEDIEQAEKNKRAHLAQGAKRILGEPLMQKFFEDEEAQTLEAMKRLPMGASLGVYETIHHNLLATIRLRERLETYIKDFESSEIQERFKVKDVDGI